MFGGPQFTREKNWLGQTNDDIFEQRDDLKLTLNQSSEKQVLEGEIIRLKRECSWTQDQLQRVLKELKFYQVKYPTPFMNAVSDETSDENLPVWISSPELLGPLITSYDARICEHEDNLSKQAHQLEILHDKFQEILAENEALRQSQLEIVSLNVSRSNKHAQFKNGQTKGKSNFSGGFNLEPLEPINSELIAELNERVDILMSENALLLEQKTLLSRELEQYQVDLSNRTEDVTLLSAQVNNMTVVVQRVESQLMQAERDRTQATEQLLRYSNDFQKLEVEKGLIEKNSVIISDKYEESEKSMISLKKQLKEVLQKFDDESLAYMRRTKLAEERVNELHSALLRKTQEFESSQDMIRKLKRDYQNTRQDAEGMLQVMTGLERQISEFSNRENELERRAKECKEISEESIVAKDQAITRGEQYKIELERITSERSRLLQARQDDIDNAVSISKAQCMVNTNLVEKALEELTAKISLLNAESENNARESRNANDSLLKLQRLHDDERRSTSKSIKYLEEQLFSSIEAKEELERRCQNLQETNKDLRNLLDKARSQSETARLQSETKQRLHENEIASLRQLSKEVTRECSEKNRILVRNQKEFDDCRINFDDRLILIEKQRSEEIKALQQHVADLETNLREAEKFNYQELNNSAAMIEKMKEKSKSAISVLECRLTEERQTIKTLIKRISSLETALLDIQNEHICLTEIANDAKRENKLLISDNDEAQEIISTLTFRLSSPFIHDHAEQSV